jgi:hypothetical protein
MSSYHETCWLAAVAPSCRFNGEMNVACKSLSLTVCELLVKKAQQSPEREGRMTENDHLFAGRRKDEGKSQERRR